MSFLSYDTNTYSDNIFPQMYKKNSWFLRKALPAIGREPLTGGASR